MTDIFTDSEQTRIRSTKDLLETYLSPLFYDKHSTTAIVAGGFFASVLQSGKIKDIDIFFPQTTLSGHKFYKSGYVEEQLKSTFPNITTLTQSPITEYGFNENIKQVWNANIEMLMFPNMNYQLIFTSYKNREEIIADFDYRHCCVSYSVMDKKLYISRATYDAIVNKHLIVNNPVRVHEYRRNKYLNRGYIENEVQPVSTPFTSRPIQRMAITPSYVL